MTHDLKQLLSEWGLFAALVIVVGLIIYVMVSTAGQFVVRAEVMMRPENVRRRAMELQWRMAEQRIARIGEETRAALQAAAERRRREGSADRER